MSVFDGDLARAYDRGRALPPQAEEQWRRAVLPLVDEGAVVLDVGAGTGRFARLFPNRVVAVEPAAGMRAGRGDEAVWVAGGAEALPLRDASVDVAWLAYVVHHVDLAAAGRELARVVRPGGLVLVWSTFPDRFDDLEWLRWFPAARAIDEERFPAVDALVAAWPALTLESRTAVDLTVAADHAALVERLSHRAISTLRLISDEDYERGMAGLRAADLEGPFSSGCDLLVLRR